MPTRIFVAVYKNKLDSYKFRHTAVYLEFADGETTLLNIEGVHPSRKFWKRPGNNPRNSKNHLGLCLVAILEQPISRDEIEAAVASTPVSQDPEADCHQWVGKALTQLQNHGYLTKSERDGGVEQMTDMLFVDSNEG